MLKELRRNYKRIVAFMLTVAMTFTNIGSNLSVAFAAGETEEALFMLNGNDLQSAIQDAVEGGEVFDFSSLELTAKSKSLKTSYEKLLGTKSGTVYALDVEIDDSYAPDGTSMEAFYNAGTEDVVFLFINESDMVVTFRANVDGYETNRVTINPNAANVEDDADAGYVEDYSNTTMVDDTPETLGATVVPAQSEEGNAVETETVESVEAEEADVVETEAAAETEESEEVASEAEKETVVETEAEEVVIETEAETEAEIESEVESEAEVEAEQSEESAVEVEEEAADEVQVGLSMHAVSRVATTVEILDDEVPMTEEAPAEDTAEEETVGEETTAEETVVESAAAETIEAEKEAVEETKAEEIVIETEAADESSAAEGAPSEVVVEEETAAAVADEVVYETPSDADRNEAFEDEDGQMLIDDINGEIEVLGDLDGRVFNTVTLWGSANARAYRVALEDLKGVETFGNYSVDYSVDPVGAADIKGSDSIVAGGDLYFGVTPQVGYELVSVTANGVELEAVDEAVLASASDVADYEYVYVVEAVDEDLEIIASLEEISAHPAFEDSVTINGVTVTASAEEGIIPEGTVLDVTEVTEQVAEAVAEKLTTESDDNSQVTAVIAYDINLLLNGKKLNNSWSENGYVNVVFSGSRIEETSKEAEQVEIVYVDTASEEQLTADNVEGITAKDLVIETKESVAVKDGASVGQVEFKADHFTIYAYVTTSNVSTAVQLKNMTLSVGDIVYVYSDSTYNKYYSWTSSDESVVTVTSADTVTVNGGTRARAQLTVVSAGSATISYGYGYPRDSATITVEGTGEYDLYAYTLVPGMSLDSTETADSVWNGMGVMRISGVNAPSTYTIGTYISLDECTISYAESYPDITVNGKTYKYAAPGNENATKEGYYTIEWIRLVVSNGANAGNNGYNPVVNSGTNTFHLDGQVFINEANKYNVTFRIKQPGSETFVIQENYSRIVESETLESSLTKPSPDSTVTYNGIEYVFDGWYIDEACTTKTNFDGTITENRNYYGRYVPQFNITVEGHTGIYDGQSHTLTVSGVPSGAAVKYVVNGTEYDIAPTVKDVETKTVSVVVTFEGVEKTADAVLKVTQRDVTLTSASAEKQYDGTALTNSQVTVTGDGFVTGEGASYTVTGSQTLVGKSDNTFTYTLNANTNAKNYEITTDYGTLNVTDRTELYAIEVVANSGKYTYDGTEKTVSGFKDLEFTFNGQKYTVTGLTAKTSKTDAGTYSVDVIGTAVVVDAEGNDVTEQFSVTKTAGQLVINQAPLIIETLSDSKEYDGTALTASGSINGLVEGEATFTVTGSQTEVGESTNSYSLVWNGNAKASNYSITETLGTLKVTESTAEITVTTIGGEFTYDGKAHGAVVSVSGLPAGYILEKAESSATATDVTSSAVAATADILEIRNAQGVDVTKNLRNIKYVDGTITIKPATLTIKTESASKVYDGTVLTAPGTITGFVDGDTATFTVTGNQKTVGSSENTYSLVWNGTAKETNYTIEKATTGILTVTEYADEIVVTTTGGEFTYDGQAHGATVTVSTLPTGYIVQKAVSNDTATDVTSTAVTAKCDELVIINADGVDVTSKLNIRYANGSIKINPATLTVVTPDASKTYDGTALTAEGKITGFVNGETATFRTTGSQTDVGSSKNTYSLSWNGMAKQNNYTVKETLGTLTVNESTALITVTTTGGVFTYDGQARGAVVEVTGIPNGYRLVTAVSNATATDVTKTAVAATCDTLVIVNTAGVDVTDKLNTTKVDGSITINPATLTVVTPDASKVYDGKALTSAGSIEGFVNNETATFETTGTQTNVGTSDNTYKITWDGTAKESNYTVSATVGKLTVTESEDEIIVTTTGGIFTYDGRAHGATVAVSTLPTGYTLQTATSNATATDVTAEDVTATCDTLVIVNAQGTDVTNKLNIKYADGTIKINPAILTIVTPNASKTYDGEALTAAGTIEGFVNGETATFKTTGTQTNVGSSKNTYSLVWDGTAKATNYTINDNVGMLTVDEYAGEITVTTTGGTFTYDGEAHGATVKVSELPKGYTLETATSDAAATDVTINPVAATCDTLVIKNAAGKDVTDALKIKYVDGTITINPATLTVTTPTDSKAYDGEALTASGSVTGFVKAETATFVTTGSQTAVGSSTNTYSLIWDGTAKESNYTISESLGTLTVTESKDEIVVTTTGGTFVYDGKSHGATVEVTNVPKGYKVVTATSDDIATNVTTADVVANCDTLVIVNAANEDVTGKLNIRYVNGSIKITPAPLTIATPNAEKVYDGVALTAAGSINGFVNNETATFATTGTQTEVGDSKNTYSLVWDGTAKESNYAITESIGTLTVTENTAEIVVTTTGGKFVYDGQAHDAAVTVSELPKGYTLETAASDDTATDVTNGAIEANCDTLVIRNAEGKDVTEKLNITYKNDTIEITPAVIIVTTPDASKVYDGDPLTKEGAISGFVNDETATFVTTGSQTEVGESINTYSLTWDGTAKKTNYTVSENLGTLVVTENEDQIVVTTKGGEFVYDGKAHDATVSVSVLPKGYTLESASSDDTATDVTTTDVVANCDTLVIVNAAGEDVTSKLNIKYVDDVIRITPAPLTITTNSASKVYDGTPLKADGSIKGLVNGESVTFNVTGSRTTVGTSDNTYSIVWDNAKITNYEITKNIGKLTVTEYAEEITVTTTGGVFPYDGQVHGATVSVSTLPKGYTLEKAISNDTATNVADGTVEANCDVLVIRNAEGEDVTSKLNISYVDGSIKINPVTLTIETPDDTKVYDGTALTKAGTINGFVNNETATFVTTGTQTKVGSSKNTYTLTWDGTAVESNYTINETIGTLTVTENASEIVVTTTGSEVIYDGQVHGATVSVSTLPTGYRLETAESKDTATHVAEGTVKANCDVLVIRNAEGEDVTSKLNITYVDGTIKINPAPLTITTPNAEKVYDGDALTASGSISGFVNGENATFATIGSQTEVGNSKNTYSLTWDGTAAETDYTISETIGTLTVTEYAEAITVTTTGGEFTYDGQVHGATVSVSTLPNGYSVEKAESKDTATNVTEGTVEANCDTLVIVNAQGKDVTSKLNIIYADGTIKINPAELIVTTPSASKVYDGTALTKGGTITGFVNDETATFVTTGTQTVVGESQNTYDLKWNKTAEESNYTVKENIGILKVTEYAGEITVITTGGEFIYDGKVHGATVGVSTLPTGYTLETAISNDAATNVAEGTVEANCDTLVIKNAEGEDVTSKLNITYVDGTIKINPAELAITTPNASKVYDATALTAEGTMIGLVKDETATFTTTGTQTLVGSSKNTYDLVWAGTAVESNYKIKEVIGTLTVTDGSEPDPEKPVDPDKVVVKTHESKEYRLNDKVTFTITVTNIYDEAKTITITEREGVTITGESVFVNVPAGEKVTTIAEYVITEADILAGKFTNTVTAAFSGGNTFENTDEVDTEDPNGHLTIRKNTISTPSNAEKDTYELGSTIKYQIDAVNDGNMTLTDVVVTDELTGDTWNIEKLVPGASETFYAEYVVTEADILKGSVVNVATASGSNADPQNPQVPVKPDEETDPTDVKNASLFVEKTAAEDEDGNGTYALGEKITYTIVVLNNGNVTVKDIKVKDDLTGDEWTIDALAPGESETFTAEYEVKEKDILAGEIVNVATATGKDPEGEKVTGSGEEKETSDPQSTKLSVQKEITNEGFVEGTTKFSIGDTINYKITVSNLGNITQYDVPVEDVTTGKGTVKIDKVGWFGTNFFARDYVVDGTTITIKELAPGQVVEINCSYVVVRDDNGTTVVNQVIAGNDTTEKDDVPAEVEKTYDINVKHEFADVNSDSSVKLPDDYVVENKLPGYSQKFVAGTVKGYAASPAVYNVLVEDKDITITFVYYKDTIGTDPTNPSKPDQIPDYYQITFTFVSEDTAKGTVTDVTREVHNLYEIQLDENGRVVEVDLSQVKPVSPNAKVTVTPANKYKFTKWTSDNARVQEAIAMAAETVGDNFNTTEEIREAAFITDTVFTAHFAKKSSGGGGGGGGSTPGGGSTTTIGGPGVPTASLPEVPVLEVQEEEVPLAALPKTGRTNANALVMLLSSVMLAAFAVTGKKKEEEN